jgi:hypothetical protein
VEKPGARRSARENYYTVEDCDHMTVCKPSDKEHPSYHKLVDFIITCREEVSFVFEFIFQLPYFFAVTLWSIFDLK